MPGGKGERRGKGDRLCFICKLPGHIARFCPHKDPQARQYVGRGQALEAGRQFVAAVEHYSTGGTEESSQQDLHDQMGDGEGEIAAVDIMHVATTLASKLTGQEPSAAGAEQSRSASGSRRRTWHFLMDQQQRSHRQRCSWVGI